MHRGHALLIAFLALAAALAPAASPAGGEREKNLSKYCSERGDLGLSHGGCVALFTAGNIVPHDALICRDPDIQRRLGASNHGQCVAALKERKRTP